MLFDTLESRTMYSADFSGQWLAPDTSRPESQWQIQVTADFTGDGIADRVWRNTANGNNVLEERTANGTGALRGLPSVADTKVNFVSAGEIEGTMLTYLRLSDGQQWNLMFSTVIARTTWTVPTNTTTTTNTSNTTPSRLSLNSNASRNLNAKPTVKVASSPTTVSTSPFSNTLVAPASQTNPLLA